MGWMSHGETCPLGAGIHLSLYYGSTSPLCLTSLLDSLQDLPPCLVILDPRSSHSWVLLPGLWEGIQWSPAAIWVCWYSSWLCLLFSLLGPTLNPSKERSTDECYVFANPIIWYLSPPVWVHHSAQEMGGV